MRLERRLEQPRWLLGAVPVGSIAFAFVLMAIVLVATGHDPRRRTAGCSTPRSSPTARSTSTLVFATPIVFTDLPPGAFRMQLYNIGGEGQFYLGAIAAVGIALYLGDLGVDSTTLNIAAMVVAGAFAGAAWAAIPAILRAFAHERDHHVVDAELRRRPALTYLIIDSHSYWRDVESFEGQTFPSAKPSRRRRSGRAPRSTRRAGSSCPLGFMLAIVGAVALWALYSRTRFGFELQVIGDSARTAQFAGMRLRRKIVAVMCISGAAAGVGGRAEGDFAYQIDPTGLQSSFYGYTGIVVAALARYNPIAVVPVGFFIGGLQNAGFTLQGADFPVGLVGVMQGLILFCALGGEVLVRYRVRFAREEGALAGRHRRRGGIVTGGLASRVTRASSS